MFKSSFINGGALSGASFNVKSCNQLSIIELFYACFLAVCQYFYAIVAGNDKQKNIFIFLFFLLENGRLQRMKLKERIHNC
jgi:hypothetical protein